MTPFAVLHVTSLHGGGVDRHIRDIARTVPRGHLYWHAGDTADVIEEPGRHRFHALDRERIDADDGGLVQWLRGRGVGLVHFHAVTDGVARRARWAMRRLGLAGIATLHDVLFLTPRGFEPGAVEEPDREWLARTSALIREAAAVVAPSDFVADLARRHIGGIEVAVIPNGSPRREASARATGARAEFAAQRPKHVVAVLGAIGPHKGSDLLEAVASALEGTDIGIVVIGYLDRQLAPGWRIPGRLFVHGTFSDEDIPALLRAYDAKLGLFLNRAPESFSYSLSDLWDAGIPVLAAPRGALAERIARHGGGWLLPDEFDVAHVVDRLRGLFSGGGSAERTRVESELACPDAERVPPLETMARSLEALYARYGIDADAPIEPGDAAIQSLLAKNLDGSIFRLELERYAGDLAQMRREMEGLQSERDELRRFETEARGWIAKLERDVESLNKELARVVPESQAFGRLPGFLRKLLLKKTDDARS